MFHNFITAEPKKRNTAEPKKRKAPTPNEVQKQKQQKLLDSTILRKLLNDEGIVDCTNEEIENALNDSTIVEAYNKIIKDRAGTGTVLVRASAFLRGHRPEQPQSSAGETKSAETYEFTTKILQADKEEDIIPRYKETDTHIAMYVGDGHGGRYIKLLIDNLGDDILNNILEFGPSQAVEKLRTALKQQVQNDVKFREKRSLAFKKTYTGNGLAAIQRPGAMFCAALYEKNTRKVSICSLGDCTCNIYRDGKAPIIQPFQDGHLYENDADVQKKCTSLGIRPTDRHGGLQKMPSMTPRVEDDDGRVYMDYPDEWGYFNCKLPSIQACFGFLGHYNMDKFGKIYEAPRLEPICTEYELGPGPFRIFMGSDGISDVMNDFSPILMTNSASYIAEECKKRWTTRFFTVTPEVKYRFNLPDTTIPAGALQGPDDISCLVLDVS